MYQYVFVTKMLLIGDMFCFVLFWRHVCRLDTIDIIVLELHIVHGFIVQFEIDIVIHILLH